MKAERRPRICVPICERSVEDVAHAAIKAGPLADLIEIRLDCVESFEWESIRPIVANSTVPLILTFRPPEQGGSRELSRETRKRFWSDHEKFGAEFYDLELDLANAFAADEDHDAFEWNRIICSHHNFDQVPDDLALIYERLAHTPARILKIAVQANDITDCIPVFALLDRARADGRELIAIAMGAPGIPTRVLGPSRGAFLTYGPVETSRATAPGQITATELRDVYRIDQIDSETQILGLVGLPVVHSVSPHIHNDAFTASRINAVYMPFEVHDLGPFMKRMIDPRTRELEWNLRGLSVTAPYKSQVMEFLDSVDPAAEEIGAVNTIVVENTRLRGYNTDARGFLKPLLQKFSSLRDARCAVIGAGGAASAALWSLRQEGASVTVFARDVNKGRQVAERFGARCERFGDAEFGGFDIIINATPMGTRDALEDETPLVAEQIAGARLAYDLVYNPEVTCFLRAAQQAGCDTLGGLQMLLAQAVEQFKLWTGQEAPEQVMRDATIRALERHRESR